MNVYQIYGTENLGWFTKEEAYKISENLHAAVYAFAFCEVKPEADLYPHEVQNSFYVGQSGNEEGKHSFYDQKVRIDMGGYLAPKYGRYTTVVKKRLKHHYSEFEKQKSNQSNTYKLFHETFTPSLRPNYQVFCNLMVPSKSVSSDATKAWLRMVEATAIYCYHAKWGKPSLCNLENKNRNTRMKGSISEFKIRSNEENNLNGFFV